MNFPSLSHTNIHSGGKLDLGIDFSLLQAPSNLTNQTDGDNLQANQNEDDNEPVSQCAVEHQQSMLAEAL